MVATTMRSGVSAYFDTFSSGQLALYLYWPVDGTDSSQDLGTSHVTGDLSTEIDIPIPSSGSGTVNLDQVLTYLALDDHPPRVLRIEPHGAFGDQPHRLGQELVLERPQPLHHLLG